MNIRKNRFSTSYGHKEWGENKKVKRSQGEKLAKRGNETIAVAQKKYNRIIETLLEKQVSSSLFETGR